MWINFNIAFTITFADELQKSWKIVNKSINLPRLYYLFISVASNLFSL